MTARREDGFTLIELLVAVVITGIIASVISSCLIVGLKTIDGTSDRVAGSHDAQLVSTYLPADIQSSGSSAADVSADPAALSGCGPAGDESNYGPLRNVLRLRWSETSGTTTTFTAAYQLGRESSSGDWQLLRYSCQNAGPATSTLVARQLKNPGTTPPTVDLSHAPALAVRLTTLAGFVFDVSAVRRTPSTTPIVTAPWDCTIQSALATPDPVVRTTSAPGPLANDLAVEVQSGGACSGLDILIDPDGASPYSKSLMESPANSGHWIANVSRSIGSWTDGDKVFPIRQASVTLGSLRLTVRPPCLVSTFAAVPTPAGRTPGAAPGPLSSDLSLSVSATGPCAGLRVDGQVQAGVPLTPVALTEVSPGTWTGTVAAGSIAWSDGSHTLTVHEPAGPDLRTTGVIVMPNCGMVSGSVSPSPVSRSGTSLASDVALSLSTSGTCAGLQARIVPGSGAATVIPMTGSPTAWTATLSKSLSWTSGSKTITVATGDGDALRDATGAVVQLTLVVS